MLPDSVLHRFSGQRLTVLVYHAVSEAPLPHVSGLYAHKTPAQFESDLRYLTKTFRFLSYQDLIEYDGPDRVPYNSALLTVDDGYVECFTVIRPLLKKYAVPCIFFVTTDWIDNRRLFWRNKVSLCVNALRQKDDPDLPLTLRRLLAERIGASNADRAALVAWLRSLPHDGEDIIDAVGESLDIDFSRYLASATPYLSAGQVQILASEGFSIGAHTCTHRPLSHLPRKEIVAEVARSVERVADWTGATQVPFAFPFTHANTDLEAFREAAAHSPHLKFAFGMDALHPRAGDVVPRLCAEQTNAAGGFKPLSALVRAWHWRAMCLRISAWR